MTRKRKTLPVSSTAIIEKFSHDGRGIARINGKTTFIDGALPEETVSFEYLRTKKDYDEGRLVEVIKASVHRANPRCQHYQLCGGCSLQHLDEETQIQEKQTLLLDMFQRIGHCEPDELLEPLSAGSWNYRNKARLSVRYVHKKQAVLVGFREKNNPRYITEISHCPVLHKKVDDNIQALRQLMGSLESPEKIAQIEVAAGDEEVALILRNLDALSSQEEQQLKAFADASGFILYLQPGNSETVKRFYPESDDEFLHYELPEEGIRYQFHPTDFTQINARLNRLMISKALELLELNQEDTVLDLFCGLGNFSLPIAKRCRMVIGFEGSETMVERAAMNARINQLDNLQFYAANLDEPDVLAKFNLPGISKMLIDPPRSGALEIMRQIDKLKPERIIYVSCNPATLARDSDILVNQKGYRFIAAGVMDMFPHTSHVESIAVFQKEK
ncbi:23S rRNA (uracil(1939)-C(5))-methyltransferase RlmD [Legionella quinlivanii]|uniref:23S rRNA (uracil(1939)-C(5))-methyltransferase RlmD n=1 Tax=Legionella quinlivanii TaxID=45073 RepID=UPI002243AD8B|nr:23S rRNA (uracil(1939)-C(5))-methyltransferase RlmD [Legionella quinlivanii]MCW8450697.1 23S rRNA (uracil(1939)-C(5))-methyltransferase RlmD [Legionella quinlivanii]